jgi:predicted alpha/beta hydrolase family esterase
MSYPVEGLKHRSTSPLVLTVPGLDGSGPAHWQTLWEAREDRARRVDMGDWARPNRNMWVNRLNLAIHRAQSAKGSRPIILVAHSLGCLTVAWWAHYEQPAYGDPVIGALLVAPPDVDGPLREPRLQGFAPTPLGPLPFPSMVVASRDDPWGSFDHSERLATFWGSKFVDAGDAGHINADSGLGGWDDGRRHLSRLARQALTGPVRVPEPSPMSIFA